MACFALAVRYHDGDDSPIGVMIRAMAPPFIEQHEAFMTQEGCHLGIPSIAGRIVHLFNEFGTLAHSILSSRFSRPFTSASVSPARWYSMRSMRS